MKKGRCSKEGEVSLGEGDEEGEVSLRGFKKKKLILYSALPDYLLC
jgi:hypothetical protein